MATAVWLKKHTGNNYTRITENDDLQFLRSEVQVFLHKVSCNTAALGVHSHNCTIITAPRYIHSHANIRLQPNYSNRQSSFLCCVLRRVNFRKLLLGNTNHHVSNKCLPGGRAGTARGPPGFQVTYVVSNFSPFHQTFIVIFLSRLPVAECQRMCTQHPLRFATCLSLCGLRKLVTAFGWFDWSSGNGSWWRWDLQSCQLPGGVIFQQKVTPTVWLRQSSDSTYRLRNL